MGHCATLAKVKGVAHFINYTHVIDLTVKLNTVIVLILRFSNAIKSTENDKIHVTTSIIIIIIIIITGY